MTSTLECSEYCVNICIKDKRQYNHWHQVGKQMHVIFENKITYKHIYSDTNFPNSPRKCANLSLKTACVMLRFSHLNPSTLFY